MTVPCRRNIFDRPKDGLSSLDFTDHSQDISIYNAIQVKCRLIPRLNFGVPLGVHTGCGTSTWDGHTPQIYAYNFIVDYAVSTPDLPE